MAAVASAASWAPSSPRLSFSRDFVQSEVFSPSPASSSRPGDGGGDDVSQDFDFGMLALLRMGDPGAATPMLPADELFSNGRLIAKGLLPAEKSPTPVDMPAPTKQQQVRQPEHPPHASQSSSIASSRRWRELFGRHKTMRSASLSEMEQPLTMAAASSSSSSVSPSTIKCTKLKLLFRSSSAGGSLSRRHPSEPCLGRSASESKASCCSCCTARSPLAVLGPNAATAVVNPTPPPASSASSGSRVLPPHKQQQPPTVRRRTLSETSYQKLGQTSSAPRRPSGSKKADAWKAYTNSTDRVISASSSASSSSSGAKAAQVLHMDVCMGQSMVVSRVAKAFKKDNRV